MFPDWLKSITTTTFLTNRIKNIKTIKIVKGGKQQPNVSSSEQSTWLYSRKNKLFDEWESYPSIWMTSIGSQITLGRCIKDEASLWIKPSPCTCQGTCHLPMAGHRPSYVSIYTKFVKFGRGRKLINCNICMLRLKYLIHVPWFLDQSLMSLHRSVFGGDARTRTKNMYEWIPLYLQLSALSIIISGNAQQLCKVGS